MLPMFISVNYSTVSKLVKYEVVTNSQYIIIKVSDDEETLF